VPEVVVIAHAITWHARDLETKLMQHWSAKRGDVVDLPDEVAARFRQLAREDGLPRVGTREELAAWEKASEVPAPGVAIFTNAQLQAMSPEQLNAVLNQNNYVAYQVLALEEQRDMPRQAIVDQANAIIDTVEGRPPAAAPTGTPSTEAAKRAARAEQAKSAK
jgi:hypothetical protein